MTLPIGTPCCCCTATYIVGNPKPICPVHDAPAVFRIIGKGRRA